MFAFLMINGGSNYGYGTTDQVTGQLTITKLDPEKAIISGTFWFDAVRLSDGEKVQIREGRFDMEYTP